jgi:dihydrodipicolinate synthase/N-acetylneuraminate lyase
MKSEELRAKMAGPVFPIPTPFTDDFKIDYASINSYVEFLIEAGAKTLMVTVGTSRFSLLTTEDIISVNAAVVEATAGMAVTIAANPIVGPTSQSIEVGKEAEKAGADLFLAIYPERYYTDEAICGFFSDIARSLNIGVLIHEMHMRTGIGGPVPYPNYSIELIGKLLGIENVLGMKEECNDLEHAEDIYREFSESSIIVGGSGGMGNFLKAHQHGSLSYLVGIGNFLPELEIEFYSAVIGGNSARAEEIVSTIEAPFFDAVVPLGWHPALKEAMEFKGLIKATERPPMLRIDEAGRAKIKEAMERSQLL